MISIAYLLGLALLFGASSSSAAETQKTSTTVQILKDAVSDIELVPVKGGCYIMGGSHVGDEAGERPAHSVCLSDFYLGKFEVTQKQWQAVMGNNPTHFTACGPNCPMEEVSWNDVQDFIKKLNSKSAKKYRLPTEAEWEYAARSGGKDERYAGANSPVDVAWFADTSGTNIHPVGQKQPNGLGLYDMTGNVWEWVQDWYGLTYYRESLKNDPQGPKNGTMRVVRGGCALSDRDFLRTDFRTQNHPDGRFNMIGFRIAVSGR